MNYKNPEGGCPNCGRYRVEEDGVCEKCEWDSVGGDYMCVTRPRDWDIRHGHIIENDNNPFEGYLERQKSPQSPSVQETTGSIAGQRQPSI